MSSLFYLVAIISIYAAPLAVPVWVSIVHAVRDWRERLGSARPAFKPAFGPALAAAAA